MQRLRAPISLEVPSRRAMLKGMAEAEVSDVVVSHAELLRLRELAGYRGIYDAISPQLDPITALIADLCNVPIAGVSIVDDKDVFIKSRFGIDVDSLKRFGSFCGAAIEHGGLFFEVPDTTLDLRFRESSLVTSESHIRAYAAVPLLSPNGYRIGTLWVMDRSAHRFSEKEVLLMQAMAKQVMGILNTHYVDSVTQLLNRRGFLDAVETLFTKAKETGTQTMVCAFEASEVQMFRDAHGWDQADKLKLELARQLQSLGDGAYDICAHLGDGRFAYATLRAAEASVDPTLERLRALERTPLEIDEVSVSIQLRVGVSECRDRTPSAAALLDEALLASRLARESGVPHAILDAESVQVRKRAVDLVGRVRTGLLTGEFVPFCQPQVDFSSGRIVGFEVLARWLKKGTKQALAPGAFLHALETGDLLADLDLAMFDQTCGLVRQWLDEGHPVLRMVSNLSRSTLSSPRLLEAIDRTMARHRVPATYIGFEVTESHLMREPGRAKAFLEALRERGIYVALDDFGTGFSNLASLRNLQFDVIKVDRMLVHGLSRDPAIMGLFKLVQGVAQGVGCEILCEGVEEPEDIAVLAALGATTIQGWFFAPAVPGAFVPTLSRLGAVFADLPEPLTERAAAIAKAIQTVTLAG